jgi:paraquat-inducible protein A
MHIRNKISLGLIALSFGLLFPGLTQPVFNLGVDVKVLSSFAEINSQVVEQSKSILGTVSDLYERDRVLVGTLILLFSVVVPFLKGLMLIGGILHKSPKIQLRLYQLVNAIGKWSMADVFVVAVFLVFLSTAENTSATKESLNVLGIKLPLEIKMLMDSNLGPGFYWFLAYCLLSLATLHVIKKPEEAFGSKKSR